MILPIRCVLRRKGSVLNNKKVFCVFFLCRLGKIERTSQDFISVNHHDFIVRDGVFGVNKCRDAESVLFAEGRHCRHARPGTV